MRWRCPQLDESHHRYLNVGTHSQSLEVVANDLEELRQLVEVEDCKKRREPEK
jgi:hypothetical protein